MYEARCVQPPDAENRTSGGVGGCRGAILGTRPDQCSLKLKVRYRLSSGAWVSGRLFHQSMQSM
jgi:hypothetical protein